MKQWDATKDISQGVVRKSPFTPTSPTHPPQLRQQKQQWDIPGGKVYELKNVSLETAAKPMERTNSFGSDINSSLPSGIQSGILSPSFGPKQEI